jgi:uncharacterized membrane protein
VTASSSPLTPVTRWGGIAGVAGSLVLVGVFVLVAALIGTEPADPEGLLIRFPEVRATHLVENTLYLVTIALWALHSATLHQALRRVAPGAALAGVTLTLLGLAMLAAGALPHLWQIPLSDAHHAAGTNTDAQTMLVFVWQATQGVFNALLVTGLVLLLTGTLAYGIAMRRDPAVGAVLGWLAVGLSVVGVAAAAIALVQTAAAAVSVVALVAWYLVAGVRALRPSGHEHAEGVAGRVDVDA